MNNSKPINTISASFAKDDYYVYLSLLIIIIAGLTALLHLPRIEDPRITTRNAIITTELPGASATRIEAEVTKPIEDRIREISEVKRIESTSRANISVITLELQDNITRDNNEAVFSKIRDKLNDAQLELPLGSSKPALDDKRGAIAFTLITGVKAKNSTDTNLAFMNRIANELADRLKNIPGTEIVRSFGDPEEEVRVTIDRQRMHQTGIRIDELNRVLVQADSKIVSGTHRSSQRDMQLEITGEFEDLERIRSIPIKLSETNSVLTLNDIANVEQTWKQPETEIALIDGERAIFVAARMNTDVQIGKWAEKARLVIDNYQRQLDSRYEIIITYDESHYTIKRLNNLASNLLLGALVIMVVVMLFMGLRSALIVGSALPLSIGISLFSLSLFGQQLHQMSIFGLIVAIGLLIDNAIVMTEQVRKNMNRGLSKLHSINHAVELLTVPLLASTLTTVLGFMPVFLLQGNVGDFVSPIAISVVIALVTSFIIAMILIPALTVRFAHPSAHKRNIFRDGVSLPRVVNLYRILLSKALAFPLITMLLITMFAFSGFYLASHLGNVFFPSADRDHFQVEVWMPADSTIQASHRLTDSIQKHMETKDDIQRITWLIGGSTPPVYYNAIQTQDANPAYSQAVINMQPNQPTGDMVTELQRELDYLFPQAQIVVSPFGQGPPIEAPLGFRISGTDVEGLKYWGDVLRQKMSEVPGVTHTQSTLITGIPKLWFDADEVRVKQAGLTLSELSQQLFGLIDGLEGGSILQGLERLPVRTRTSDDVRSSIYELSSMNIVTTSDTGIKQWVPLTALGNFEIKPEDAAITRRNGERVNNIYGYIEQDKLAIDIMDAIQEKLKHEGFQLPTKYRLEVSGDSEEQERAVGQLLNYLPVLLTIMIATIILSFKNLALSAVIGLVAIQSIGFGMLSLWLGGFNIGFNPLIGIAGLIGVAINGTIVVLAALQADSKAMSGDLEQIVNVTIDSGRHIISTTFTTTGGFLPLLLSGGEFWPPLAIVIAGGVGFSIFLSLIFTPTAFAFIRGETKKL